MLHIFTVAALMLSTSSALAQRERIVESSRETRPSWIGCSTTRYLAVTEVGATLAEATDKAMNTLRQHILNSVAVNVSSTEVMVSRQVTVNALMDVMNDYTSVLMTEAAKLPYLNNISPTNASDSYWERIYSRKDKSYRYEFSILYPFDEETRNELIANFLAIDNRKMEEFEALGRQLDTIDDMDKVKEAINSLEALENYVFDGTRRDEVEVLRRNYRSLYSKLVIVVEEQSYGKCIYSLCLGSRRVTTSVGARLRSDAALEMSVKPIDGKRYQLSYNPEYASPKDINSIEIIYPFGGVSVKETIYFDAPAKE